MARKLLLAASLPVLLLLGSLRHLRHVPYPIPVDVRAPADTTGGLRLRYTGVSGYELTDGKTVVLLDPTATRPTAWELITRRLRPDEALAAKVFPRADFILVNHAHHDHALDVPAIALRTGATVIGSRSVCNLALSRGVPPERVHEAVPGERLKLGAFTMDVRASRHVDLFGSKTLLAGTIPKDAGPLWFWQYTQDAALAFRLEAAGSSVWFHPTATFRKGELGGLSAGTLIFGVNGEPITADKMRAVLREAKPARLLPTHYDNFLQPLSKGLALMPGLDFEAARRAAAEAAPGLPWHVLDYGETVTLK